MATSMTGGLGGGGLGGSIITGGSGSIIGPSAHPAGGAVLGQMAAAPLLTALQVVTGVISAIDQYKAGEEAKDLAAHNAQIIEAETQEELSTMKEANDRAEARARALAAASGLSGASSELYIAALMESGRQDLDWTRKVGESKKSAAISEGRTAYHQARASMWGSIGSSIGSAVSTYSILS